MVVLNLLYDVGVCDEDFDYIGFVYLFEYLMFGGFIYVFDYDILV